jgi:mRNA-degrading endonuclease RelE of RelBE toxin-antitoxin system
MIQITFSPRFIRSLRKIKPDLTDEAESLLNKVRENFGNPHAHAGTGLRKIGERSYEARIGLHYSVVFIHHATYLEAFDIMTHEEVRQWLRSK